MRYFGRRRTQVASDSQAEMPALDPIVVFSADAVREGWITRSDQRLSDQLNAGSDLTVRWPGAEGSPGEAEVIRRDDVVVVAAPIPDEPSRLRMSRPRQRIEVAAGPYRIEGTAHIPPGAELDRYARQTSQRWLPMTECRIATPDGDFEVAVLIVSLDYVVRTEQ